MSGPISMLPSTAAALTMTSREIADLTGKRHFNVLTDVRKMLLDLEEDELRFQAIYLDSMNREQVEYALDRELTDTLLTGYSAVLRRKVIARWRELEIAAAAPALPDFSNPAAAARAWADAVESTQRAVVKVDRLESQLVEQAPAVAAFDLITNADGTLCIREAAAALQMRQCDLTDWLVEHDWIYQRPGKAGYLAYRTKLQSLQLKYRVGGYEDPTTGERKVKEQVRITGKGLASLAALLAVPAQRQQPLLPPEGASEGGAQ